MSALHNKYSSQGLTILCFPCNQFGGQEPWPEPEIKQFVQTELKTPTGIQLFQKINVLDDDVHPLYHWLLDIFPGDITWNFSARFLVDRHGIPVERLNKGSTWLDVEKDICSLLGIEMASDHADDGCNLCVLQ